MLDHHGTLLALRNRLLTMEVCTTGVTTLGVQGNAFVRSAGSFVADGFRPGMEVTPSGFTVNEPVILRSVSALEMKVTESINTDAALAGRSLTVGIPKQQTWINADSEPDKTRWYVEEEYIPGPNTKISIGPLGRIESNPLYIIKVYCPQGKGAGAILLVGQAIVDLFPPELALSLADGTVIRVRSGTGMGQPMTNGSSSVFVVITIPLWARTQNIV